MKQNLTVNRLSEDPMHTPLHRKFSVPYYFFQKKKKPEKARQRTTHNPRAYIPSWMKDEVQKGAIFYQSEAEIGIFW